MSGDVSIQNPLAKPYNRSIYSDIALSSSALLYVKTAMSGGVQMVSGGVWIVSGALWVVYTIHCIGVYTMHCIGVCGDVLNTKSICKRLD